MRGPNAWIKVLGVVALALAVVGVVAITHPAQAAGNKVDGGSKGAAVSTLGF
jgi:hypothetical protein